VSFLHHLSQRGFSPTHIVDVGANRGKWSTKARRVFPDCDFTLIEPQIEMKPRLERFCRGGRARWIQAGAADAMAEMTLTIDPNTVGTSFDVSDATAQSLGREQRTVPVITLDHVVADVIRAIPELVKIDAEGFEAKIIQGAGSLLGKTEVFLLEARFDTQRDNPRSLASLLDLMAQHDYVPYDFTWFLRHRQGGLTLCEIAFTRRCGQLRNPTWQHEVPRRAA